MPADSNLFKEIKRFEEKYAQDPHGLAFARLADSYRKAGELERGLALVEEGLARHPDYLNARIVCARILSERGETSPAVAAFRAVLELDRQNLVALRALGDLARSIGDREAARGWYERVLEVEPLGEDVRALLEELRDEPGPATETGSDEARERAEPGHEEATAAEGEEAEPRSELTEDAEASWLASLEPPVDEPEFASGVESEGPEEPDDVETATLAELYLKQGLYEEALRIYARLARRDPEDFFLREKLKTARLLAERGPLMAAAAAAPTQRPVARDAASAMQTAVVTQRTPAADAAAPEAEAPAGAHAPVPDIREYLRGLLGEAAAAARVETRAARFDSWLRRTEPE